MKKTMKILIAYDGSACADTALADLKKAGLPRRADALALSVADVFLPTGKNRSNLKIPDPLYTALQWAKTAAQNQLRRADGLAKQAKRKIKASFPRWRVKHLACADSPAWAIVKKAEAWKPDLIVMGSQGHSRSGRFLGSVSQMVLTQAPCSVRIGRTPPDAPEQRTRVLIGVDGSPGAVETVRAVAGRAWPFDSEFRLLFVAGGKTPRATAMRTMKPLAERLRRLDATVTCEVKKGDPKRTIAKEAAAWNADCIFVGSRRMVHLKRFFIGGVSTAVAAQARCSVEVIRPRPR